MPHTCVCEVNLNILFTLVDSLFKIIIKYNSKFTIIVYPFNFIHAIVYHFIEYDFFCIYCCFSSPHETEYCYFKIITVLYNMLFSLIQLIRIIHHCQKLSLTSIRILNRKYLLVLPGQYMGVSKSFTPDVLTIISFIDF